MKKIVTLFILAILLGASGGAEENTHQCYLHPFLYNQNFGDVLNIYGCLAVNSFCYYNAYDVQGL